MAAQTKFTVKRGQVALKNVTVATGSAEAQSETLSVNIDYTALSKGEALLMIDAVKAKIHAGKWPPQ